MASKDAEKEATTHRATCAYAVVFFVVAFFVVAFLVAVFLVIVVWTRVTAIVPRGASSRVALRGLKIVLCTMRLVMPKRYS